MKSPRQAISRSIAAAIALCFLGMADAGYAQGWRLDRRVAMDLRASGAHRETATADVYFDADALPAADMSAFADLVEKGIHDIAKFLGIAVIPDRKVHYYVSRQFEISHSRDDAVYLPLTRVIRHSAPYLHETTHVIAPCADCPMWFSEGFASFVQSYVAENMGGYDGVIFARRGNRGIDRDSLRWLADKRGEAVLPFIGTVDEPPEIGEDRENVAAPFYVMAQSLVKYIVENTRMEKLRPVLEAPGFEAELKRRTGKSSVEWKQAWLTKLRQ